jgi:hypothetical protein
MAAKDFTLLDIDLHNIFDYKDGKLFYKKNPNKKVGTVSKNKYLNVCINYKKYYQHRIIFLMHHGYLPLVVDHIDGNKQNNTIENLRAADTSKNGMNSRLSASNKSGVKNVFWHKKANKWTAQIKLNNKKIHLGLFDDLELAELATFEARNKYHGEFANHG